MLGLRPVADFELFQESYTTILQEVDNLNLGSLMYRVQIEKKNANPFRLTLTDYIIKRDRTYNPKTTGFFYEITKQIYTLIFIFKKIYEDKHKQNFSLFLINTSTYKCKHKTHFQIFQTGSTNYESCTEINDNSVTLVNSTEGRQYAGEGRQHDGKARQYDGEARQYDGEGRQHDGEARQYNGEVRQCNEGRECDGES